MQEPFCLTVQYSFLQTDTPVTAQAISDCCCVLSSSDAQTLCNCRPTTPTFTVAVLPPRSRIPSSYCFAGVCLFLNWLCLCDQVRSCRLSETSSNFKSNVHHTGFREGAAAGYRWGLLSGALTAANTPTSSTAEATALAAADAVSGLVQHGNTQVTCASTPATLAWC